MIKTFKCYGGPLDGHRVTSQYAGVDYTQYNSSCGEIYPQFKLIRDVREVHISHKSPVLKKQKVKPVPYIEKAILLYTPRPKTVEIVL